MSDDGKRSPTAKKLPSGAPVAPTLKSVLVRSVLASAVFLVFLTLTSGGSAGANIILVLVMFLFLLGFGWLFDRWFYKFRLRRWEQKRAGG